MLPPLPVSPPRLGGGADDPRGAPPAALLSSCTIRARSAARSSCWPSAGATDNKTTAAASGVSNNVRAAIVLFESEINTDARAQSLARKWPLGHPFCIAPEWHHRSVARWSERYFRAPLDWRNQQPHRHHGRLKEAMAFEEILGSQLRPIGQQGDAQEVLLLREIDRIFQ